MHMHMYMHTTFRQIVFVLRHCFKFYLAIVLARSSHFGFFPAKEAFPGTQTNSGTSTKQQMSL